ncbi:MAG: sulfotransferase [Planctomycetaceae bacterium]|nr:sulfotransferase [Planctomycetaceae bacterium]
MPAESDPTIAPLSWKTGVIWMGANFPALMRLLARNRFRVHPGSVPGCLFDVGCSLVNSGATAIERLTIQSRVDSVRLDDRPVFIIGHWRTGTTLLHELLALDPRHRSPTTFECFVPNNFLLSEKLLKCWTGFLLPHNRPADNVEMGWDRPQEDEFALCNMGVPSPYLRVAFPNEPPRFDDYYELENVTDAERHRWKQAFLAFLKRVTWKRPGRLILKSPPHTFRLPLLNEIFPNAVYVHLVRDPYAVFPSTIRLWKSLYLAQAYQKPTCEVLDEYVFDTFNRMHARLEATRGLIDPSRFFELRYEDLIRDPLGKLRNIYERLSLGDFAPVEPLITAYARAHANYQPNRHTLPPTLHRQIARRWKPYIERYGYSAE